MADTDTERLRDAVRQLCRCLLPIRMMLAEHELLDEPLPDETIVLSFMGSGASDNVTAGEVRRALDAAVLALNAQVQPDNSASTT